MQIEQKIAAAALLFVLGWQFAVGHPTIPVEDSEESYVTIQPEVQQKIRELVGRINVSISKSDATTELIKIMGNEIEHVRDRERHLGDTPEFVAKFCSEIVAVRPCSDPGYYWVQGSNGPVGVYCETQTEFDQQGGWVRVAHVNMSAENSECPEGLQLVTEPRRMCTRSITTAGCSSATFNTYGVSYKKVCGRIIGYQYHSTDAFAPYYGDRSRTINDVYVDGVSLSHGCDPRQHIWTFTAALYESGGSDHLKHTCPCNNDQVSFDWAIPPFVGTDYFCETGNRQTIPNRYVVEDPLWDGKGCGPHSTCCDGAGKPWFCKELAEPTTDDIEMRLCVDQNGGENVAVEIVEVYTQ